MPGAVDLSNNGSMGDVGFGPVRLGLNSPTNDFAAIALNTVLLRGAPRYIYVSADCDLVAKNTDGTNVTFTGLKGGMCHAIQSRQYVSASGGATLVGFW